MARNALVLVIDRLGAGYCGPYGNTCVETRAWNRLAAQATLFETGLIDSPELLRLYESYWHGRHALAASSATDAASLPELLADSQVQSWLITDERLVAEGAAADAFDERVILPPGDDKLADSLEETQLARLFATVIEVLQQQATSPFLIWVHAQAMQASWDAPYQLRTQFVEPGDPEPPDFTQPPEFYLEGDYDPDLLLGIQHAYGGQVAALDACLDILLDALGSSSFRDSTALLATAARGFPMGEHGYVGRGECPLFGELVQIPWMVSCPQLEGATWRVQQTVQPPDLYTTLLDWFGLSPSQPVWGRSVLPGELVGATTPDQMIACGGHDQQRCVRVPGWFLRRDGERSVELYVKPDDRWEFNEISNRCVHVVDELDGAIAQFQAAVHANDRRQIQPLGELLLDGLS